MQWAYIVLTVNFYFLMEGDDEYFLFHELDEAKERAQQEGADICLVVEDHSIPLEQIIRAEILIENLRTGERTVVQYEDPRAWFTAMQAWLHADRALSWARLRVVWQKDMFIRATEASIFRSSEIRLFRVKG